MERLGVLGTGAFAEVSLFYDEGREEFYALKRISKSMLLSQGLRHMVEGEKKALASVKSPFLLTFHRCYHDSSSIYFLLGAALGGELFEMFNTHEDWFGSEAHAKFYAMCVANALEALHAQKIIHRDVKLENILLDSSGYGRLSDFGLAKVVLGKTYTVCGTADYLAPETLKQTGHNRAVDWWALGILIFVMMSGRSPFDADDVMQIYKNIVKGFRKEMWPSSFSPSLVEVIKGMCRKKPEERIPMQPGGFKNIKEVPYFNDGIEWDAVVAKTWKAPYVPPETDPADWRVKLKADSGMEFDDCGAVDDPQWEFVTQ